MLSVYITAGGHLSLFKAPIKNSLFFLLQRSLQISSSFQTHALNLSSLRFFLFPSSFVGSHSGELLWLPLYQCNKMSRSPELKEDSMECPLCMEPLEIDDVNFFPCTCGYQICRFCWHRIRTDENGLCPACRKVQCYWWWMWSLGIYFLLVQRIECVIALFLEMDERVTFIQTQLGIHISSVQFMFSKLDDVHASKLADLDTACDKSLFAACLSLLPSWAEVWVNMVLHAVAENRLCLSCGNHSNNNAKIYVKVWPPQRRPSWQHSRTLISSHTRPGFCLPEQGKAHNPVPDPMYNVSKHNIQLYEI